jgi:hypothetical protein
MNPPTQSATHKDLSTVDKLRMLLDITQTISRSLDLDELLNLVMDTLGSAFAIRCGGDLYHGARHRR